MIPLSILIWLPLAVALGAALLPKTVAPKVVLAGTVATLAIAISLIADFDSAKVGLQDLTDRMWIPALGIHYKLGIDGLNVWLVALTAFSFVVTTGFSVAREWDRPKSFYFHVGLAETAVLGALVAQDLALFVLFFDLMLVPFFFLTGMWGQGDRVRATQKMVIYTLVGSLLMLSAAVALAVLSAQGGQPLSFAFSDLVRVGLPTGTQELIFIGFAAAFLVKMPLFPLHGWMPDGYGAMPLPVLAIFSGVLSKVAAYGFLRIVLPILPDASREYQEILLLIALASILYGSVMAFTTTNVRLILGYSSVAQLGFITLGIFSLDPRGAQGALLQMVNHGVVTVALFLIVAVVAARAGGSPRLQDMGGIAFRAPLLATIFLIAALANLAMPGSSNFVGEFYILLGTFQAKTAIAIVAFLGVAAASVYTLRAFIRAMHNRVGPRVRSRELSLADGLAIVPAIVVILALAIYPQLPLKDSQPAIKRTIAASKLTVDKPAPTRAQVPGGTGQ